MTQEQSPQTFNPWEYKPWWCQPWSIVLTTVVLITGSWLLLKTVWLTVLISIPLLIWAIFFVFIWPRLVAPIYTSKPDLET
jgi:hypothetical protein